MPFAEEADRQQQDDDTANKPYLMGNQRRNEWRTGEVESSLLFEQRTSFLHHQSLAMTVQQTEESVSKLVKLENNNVNWRDVEKPDTELEDSHVVFYDDCVHIKYVIEGLRNYELAVKGVHVDNRILPGFKYRVRTLGRKNRYLMDGQALHLVNIGQGYGKRITFESNLHNINSNYFWSDSSDNGYGFGLVAVEPGDTFTICNFRRRPIGQAVLEDVDVSSQIELNSGFDGGDISKEVSLKMRCRVRYTCEPHGMRSLRAEETVVISGLAVITKSQEESKAITKLIKNIELTSIGPCLFVKEQ